MVTSIFKKRIVVLFALSAIPLATIFFRNFVFYTIRFWTELNKRLALGFKLILGFILFSFLHWSLSFGISKLLVHDPDNRNLNLFNTIKEITTPINLFIYASSIFILYAWIYFDRYTEAGNKSVALERELFQHRIQSEQKDATERDTPAEGIQNLVIKSAAKTVLVAIDTINVLLSYGPYVKVITAENKMHLLQRPLYQIEKLLPQNFVRVHRSHIVNRLAVKEVRSLKNGDYTLVLSDGNEIRASRTYRENIKGLLGHDRLMV